MSADATLVLVREGDLAIRRMTKDDLARVFAWRSAPHVREFWDNDDDGADGDELTRAFVDEYYGALLEPNPTVPAIIELLGAPIGYIQFYRWASEAEAARAMGIPLDDDAFGLDVFVGEASAIGSGVGARAVDLLCRWLFAEHGASRVALLSDARNARARRAYERAGFTCRGPALDTDTRGGERIASWLMVRERT